MSIRDKMTYPRGELLKLLRYVACGGFAAATNWGSRFAWQRILPFQLAVIAAYATGMVVAFILFRWLVFSGSTVAMHRQVRNFILVNLVGMALTWMIAVALVQWLFPLIKLNFYPEAIGHALAISAPIVTSWFGHKRFTFAQHKTAA